MLVSLRFFSGWVVFRRCGDGKGWDWPLWEARMVQPRDLESRVD
jgi:hypothetical protein